jgi:2-phospho-L-lactate guanylyltransferase
MAGSTSLTVVLVPLKSFGSAKSRLREVLDDNHVEALTHLLAQNVLAAVKRRPTFVVCDDDEVALFATRCGVGVLRSASGSLNGDVAEAYRQMGRFDQVVIVHGDLRSPEGLGEYQPGPGVTVVSDHHHTGTNVLCLPTALDFHFSYGSDSALGHQREAERLKIPCTVIHDSPWGFDIDNPDDLEESPYSV